MISSDGRHAFSAIAKNLSPKPDRSQAATYRCADESNHRLFVGCRTPARLVVLDTSTGKPVADVATSHDVDDMFFDAAHQRLYLSCGEGFIDIISQRDADTYALKEKVATRPGARTGFLSPVLNQFYVAVPQRDNQAAEVRVFAVQD